MNRKLTALIVGVANYPNGFQLKNPTNDAHDLTSALNNLGFSNILKTDPTIAELERSLELFRANLNSNDVGLFYFAGHGMQIDGENYLIAIDTKFEDKISVKYSSLPLNRLIKLMDECSNRTNIIILDACRNNPFTRAWDRGTDYNQLASVYTPRGTIIAFSTSPGELAGDGKGRNGDYTEALLKHIYTHDIPIEDLFKRVRKTLNTITKGKQTSWEHTSLAGDFYFNISTGRSVAIYDKNSICDSTFNLTTNNPIKSAIKALKSTDWHKQNPGLKNLSDSDVEIGNADELFVLGRNIYQAACGDAHEAKNYIANFQRKLHSISHKNLTHILDGMLFEIFFDKMGELRTHFKLNQFNNLFNLNKIHEFSDSFDFISELLINHQNRFYIIPGKRRDVTIDVVTRPIKTGGYRLLEIHFDGFNILRRKDSESDDSSMTNLDYSALIQKISREMVIPISRLAVNIDFDKDNQKIL